MTSNDRSVESGNRAEHRGYKHTCVDCDYSWETYGTGSDPEFQQCSVCGSFDVVSTKKGDS